MNPRLYLHVFTLELRKVLSYRFDFWTSILGVVLVEFGIAFFLWKAIFFYNDATEMNGYSFHGMMFYYLLVPILGNITFAQVMHIISQEIYDGSLNKYIVYPLNFFGYKFVAHLAFACIGIVQLLVALVLYLTIFDMPNDVLLNWATLGRGLIAALVCSALYFIVGCCIDMVAFWTDNTWALMAMTRMITRLLGGAMIPLAFFPEWSLGLLKVLPFYFLAAFPVETLMGRLDTSQWLQGLGVLVFWLIFFTGLAHLVWSRGKLKYSGVGI